MERETAEEALEKGSNIAKTEIEKKLSEVQDVLKEIEEFLDEEECAEKSVREVRRLNEQKQFLGERLFPLVQRMKPTLAPKITGMLLELPNSEILNFLENQHDLESMVNPHNVTMIRLRTCSAG